MKFPQDEVLRSFKDVRIYHRCIRRMQTFASATSVPSVIFTIGAHTHSTKHCNEIESDPRIQVTQPLTRSTHLTPAHLIYNFSSPHLIATSSSPYLICTSSPPHLTSSPPHHIFQFHWSTTLLEPVMKYKVLHLELLQIFENIK